jgi:hypothetical protein
LRFISSELLRKINSGFVLPRAGVRVRRGNGLR